MDKSLEDQIVLIEKLVSIGRLQLEDFDGLRQAEDQKAPEDLKQAAILKTQEMHMRVFWELAAFLTEKLRTEKDSNFFYYVPFLRTLMENYAELLYISYQPSREQFGIAIGNYLFVLAWRNSSSNGNAEADNLASLYEEYLGHMKPVLDKENITFPDTASGLSKNKFKDSGFAYPSPEATFKEQYFKDCSTDTRKVFDFKPETIYNHYRWFSDYVHGQVYVLAKFDKPSTEGLWLIAELAKLGLLMAELTNKKLLNDRRKTEFETWVKDFGDQRAAFVKYWQEKRGS